MDDLQRWEIQEFSIVGDYSVEITFRDGKVQRINFEPVIGEGWLSKLKDKDYFRRVVLNDTHNLEWPDGQDFNPEALYDWEKFKAHYEK